MNYQKIIILGNVTKDAEQKTRKEKNVSYATFRVVVSGSKEGEGVFFPITFLVSEPKS
jgi:hypothetical protein